MVFQHETYPTYLSQPAKLFHAVLHPPTVYITTESTATFSSGNFEQINLTFGENTPWRETLVDLGLSTVSGSSSFAPPALALVLARSRPREPLGDAGKGKAFLAEEGCFMRQL